ncbi:MAG: bifunctional nuclease family protein [Bacteroidales bacterium]|nr:bifunctional nuclease family protein [Bacteroidales bacterium]
MKYLPVHPLEIRYGGSESNSGVLMLLQPDTSRYIPILIGAQEAQSILMAAEGKKAKRPMPHDLIEAICDAFDLHITSVTIDKFEEGVFYATIHMKDTFVEKHIDCRTSDAVLLALQNQIEILIAESVLDETGVDVNQLAGSPAAQNPREERSMLEDLLREAEEREDYERAAEIQSRLDKLDNPLSENEE